MKIEINGKILEKYSIEKFDMTSYVNKHTKLYIELRIEKFNMDLFDKKIKIDNIFVGYINDFLLVEYDYDGFYVKIWANSQSILIDKKLKSSIYQDLDISYKNIVDRIMKKYDISYVCSKKLDQKIKQVYFQDNITDYEFLKRILSDIGQGIFVTYNGILVFGMDRYGYNKIERYREKRICPDGISYLLENKTVVQADNIENLFVIRSHIFMDSYILNSDIVLVNNAYKVKKIKPSIRGSFVEAKVVEVLSENNIAKMKVCFLLDDFEDKSVNKKSIAFATPYSRVQTGFYVEPQIGDRVNVYFPSDDESDMKVAFCINNENSSIFLNKDYRNYFSDKFFVVFDKGNIDISTENIKFSVVDGFSVDSSSYVSFSSKENMLLDSGKIKMDSKKDNFGINTAYDLIIKANKIHNN